MPARSSLKNSSTKSSISRRSSGAPASTESMSTHLPPIEMLWNNLSTISSPSLLFLAYLDSVTLQRKLAFYAQRLMETEGCVPATTSVALQQDASLLLSVTSELEQTCRTLKIALGRSLLQTKE